MIKKTSFLFLLLVFFLPLVGVRADGMIIPEPNYHAWETDQKAVIFYEGDQETLVVSTSFQGDAKSFAWIIPTPSQPKVSKGSDELFTSLAELTNVYKGVQRNTMDVGYGVTQAIEEDVRVIETKKIDYYDVTVLEANEATSLSRWLNDNGYNYPESGRYILEDYIKNGWYFTAVKINDEYWSEALKGQLRTGHATPLKFQFKTDKIVYPMRISSIVDYAIDGQNNPYGYYYNRNVGVLLYVIADNKQTLPGFNIDYAGYIKKETIEKLAYNDQGSPWLKTENNKYFLTKLYRSMGRAEMTSDLYFRQADDNKTVNAPEEQINKYAGFIIVASVGGFIFLVLLILLFIQGRRKE